jgi:hypothetical protein
LKKREAKNFTLRKTALQLGISHQTIKNILDDADIKWRVRPVATKLTEKHKKEIL